ncbi:hypothetical protein PR048_010210 [Dryococelus australis]|uniref:Uncharacterized protein n=1 Tax=Dryococelus australis TaxID=614101 RepID=A0ABQ9I247_9NEOP|nr:hypothetical protein PR048_010210 [Dryococelus australis]
MKWREIILEWKKGPGRNESTIPKDKFPSLLKKFFYSFKDENVMAGSNKCGIAPLSRNKVLQMLPSITNTANAINAIPSDTDLSSGDYAVVKVYSKFTVTNKESYFNRKYIVRKLSITTGGTTSRFKDMIIFKDDFSDTMY